MTVGIESALIGSHKESSYGIDPTDLHDPSHADRREFKMKAIKGVVDAIIFFGILTMLSSSVH